MKIDDDGDEYKVWLCAEHFDMLMRLHKLLMEDGERNYEWHPPTPGKEID